MLIAARKLSKHRIGMVNQLHDGVTGAQPRDQIYHSVERNPVGHQQVMHQRQRHYTVEAAGAIEERAALAILPADRRARRRDIDAQRDDARVTLAGALVNRINALQIEVERQYLSPVLGRDKIELAEVAA